MTYYVKTERPEFTKAFKEQLENKGFKEETFPVSIVFLSGESAYYRNHVDLKKSKLTNLIYYPDITDKAILCEKFKRESFIIDSITIETKLPELPSKFLKILKPVDGFGGKDIQIVETREEIEDWMNKQKHPKWVLQDYIEDPALINGHKFHLRVYVLVVEKKVFLYKKSEFCPAKKPYKKNDWKNKDIHNTNSAVVKYYYPETLPDGWKRKTDFTEIFQTVFKNIKLKPDWNSKNSYYLFGADVLFHKRKPILLEVNKKPGLSHQPKHEIDLLARNIVNVLLENTSDFEQII